jgi:hypothetical protein
MCELTNGKCLGGEARKSEYWHVSATALAWWQRDTQAEASPIDIMYQLSECGLFAARGLFLCATHHDVPHRLTAQ